MNRFVLDCSVSVAWCVKDESASPRAAHYLNLLEAGEAVVPALWVGEMANALVTAERGKRISAPDVAAALQLLAGLPIVVAPADIRAVGRLRDAALRHGLTAGDASYLDLALELDIPLASLDRGMRRAAKMQGIRLV